MSLLRLTFPVRTVRPPPFALTLLLLGAFAFFGGRAVAQTTINTTGSNGLSSTEGTPISGTATTDSFWADSTYLRWRMNNHSNGAQFVAAWPCTTAGCIAYSQPVTTQGTYPETQLSLGTAGSFLQAGASAPNWSAYLIPASVCSNNISLISNGTNLVCATYQFAQIGQANTYAGGKQVFAPSTTAYASMNTPPGPAPTTPADGDTWYDSGQKAEAFQQATNSTVFRGGAISGCINVTPVTASMNQVTAQDLMSCTIPAGLLNVIGKLKVWIAGFYSTNSQATAGTITISVQLGGNDICKRIPGGNYAASITNDPWEMTCYITTQTAGASAKFEAQGIYTILNTAVQTNTAAVYPMLNTSTVPVGTVDTTAAQTLKAVVLFSTNQASANSATQRQMIVEVLN